MREVTKTYKFRVMGRVVAKQSVKFGKNGIKYTPGDRTNYANWVKNCFYKEYPEHLPHELDGFNLEVSIDVYFRLPESYSKKKRALALQGFIRPTVKPDWDNISKNICDTLNGVVYSDDKNIVDAAVHKYYSEYEYVDVVIVGHKWEQKP